MSDETDEDLRNVDTATRSSVLRLDEPLDLRVPGWTILAHPDLERIGERAMASALAADEEISLSRLEPLFAKPRGARRRPLADPHLSRKPLIFGARADGGIELSNPSGLRVTIDGEPLGLWRDLPSRAVERGVVLNLADRVVLLLHKIRVVGLSPEHGLVGESAAIQTVREQVEALALFDVPVLLRGETGTGKERVARAIHRASKRREKPFVAVNMGAVPPSLAAAELFGATKGAFTGADHDRKGYFVQADGGTLFLDEIGETPHEIQALLLRTLETGIVQAVGAEREQRVDVRILAATDADLDSAIAAGDFRAPLLHRLAGSEIRLPPLRERRDDISRLLVHFLLQGLETMGEPASREALEEGAMEGLPASFLERLVAHRWSGNVRQLRNLAQQLVIARRVAGRWVIPPEMTTLLGADSSRDEASAPGRAREPEPRPAISLEEDAEGTDRLALRALVSLRRPADPNRIAGRDLPFDARLDPLVRSLLVDYEGHEVGTQNGFLLLFSRPVDAVGFALEIHQRLAEAETGSDVTAGIFLGEVRLRHNPPDWVARGARRLEVDGPAVPLAVGLAAIALPGQTLLDRGAYDLARRAALGDHPLAEASVRWLDHGTRAIDAGEPSTRDLEIFEVGVDGRAPLAAPGGNSPSGPSYRPPAEIDEPELVEALRRHQFRVQPTAKALGVSRTSLYALIDRSDAVRKARDLSREEIERCRDEHSGDVAAMAATLEVSRKGLSRRMTELGVETQPKS